MIQVLCHELKLFLLVYRLMFATTRKYNPPDIQFESDTRGVRIWTSNRDQLIELWTGHSDDANPVDRFTLSHQALLPIQTGDDEPVRFVRTNDDLLIDWEDRGVPQQSRLSAKDFDEMSWPEKLGELICPSEAMSSNHLLLEVLRDAVGTADEVSTRYALNAIKLDGEAGSITATDGRHALIQRGFVWPWEGAVLIPASNLFASYPLIRMVKRKRWPVQIWKQQDWFVMQIDQIRICFRSIEQRFPRTDFINTDDESARSVLNLDEDDARFFLERVKCLPASDQAFSPVTVDLNGAVMIRAKATGQEATVELVLSNSQREREECVFSTNREYLARAIKFGFRKISLIDIKSPAFCNDATRTYIWGLLDGGDVVPRSEGASSVCSPIKAKPAASTGTTKRNKAVQKRSVNR